MEAADDVCYNIVDLEDGHRLDRILFSEAHSLLSPIAFRAGEAKSASYKEIDKVKIRRKTFHVQRRDRRAL